MNTADAAAVAAAAAAGLLAGRAASRLTARLLAVPVAPDPLAPDPVAPDPLAPDPQAPGRRAPDLPTASPATRWSLILGTGLAFTVMAARFGPAPPLPAFCYLAGIGMPLAVIDARSRRLPDVLTLPSYPVALALLGLAALLLPGGARHFLGALLGMALAGGIFLLQVLIYPTGLGWGDVKLSGLLGVYLGWLGIPALVAGLFLGYLSAATAGLALIAGGRASRKSQLPFGPFLLGGTLAAIALSSLITASGR